MKPIRAEPTPSEDKLLRDVRAAKQSDAARGTGPRSNSPKSYHEVPDVEPTPSHPHDALHSALVSVGDSLSQYSDKIASLATVGHALKSVADKIAPKRVTVPEVGEEDTSGLFGSPAPEREAP